MAFLNRSDNTDNRPFAVQHFSQQQALAAYAIAAAQDADAWVAGAGGYEEPVLFDGAWYLYVYNPMLGEHGWYAYNIDTVLNVGSDGRPSWT